MSNKNALKRGIEEISQLSYTQVFELYTDLHHGAHVIKSNGEKWILIEKLRFLERHPEVINQKIQRIKEKIEMAPGYAEAIPEIIEIMNSISYASWKDIYRLYHFTVIDHFEDWRKTHGKTSDEEFTH